MNAHFRNRQLPYDSPFANVLVVIVGAIAIAVSFVIGVVAFLALAAAVIVLGGIIGIRIWWIRLKSRGQGNGETPSDRPHSKRSGGNTVIEGEFEVIPGEKERKEPPQT